MKVLVAVFAIVGMAALVAIPVACDWPVSNRGGNAPSDEGFRVITPMIETTVKQGEVREISINLDRGKLFKQDVALSIKASPGIAVEPMMVTVKASDGPKVSLRVSAGKDAAIGKYKIYVTGTPATGQPVMTDFDVKVAKP